MTLFPQTKSRFAPKGTTVDANQVSIVGGASVSGTESILLVEDDAAVRKVTASILSAAGYRIIEAVDGADGLRICNDPEVMIDVVVTDMVMPVMDGPARTQGARTSRPGMPMVFMFGCTRLSIVPEALASRAAFVEKPFTADPLLSAVRRVLDHSRVSSGSSGDEC